MTEDTGNKMVVFLIRDAAAAVVNGMRAQDAAKTFGVQPASIYLYLRDHYSPHEWKHKNRKKNKNFDAQLAVWMECKRRYEEEGISLAAIGKTHGVSRQRVHQMIRKARAYEQEIAANGRS